MNKTDTVNIAVKIPINTEVMTDRSLRRLRQITGRDSRIIRANLGIIEDNEKDLLQGGPRKRIEENRLREMTLTALRVKSGYKQRLTVPHDLKERFPRTSTNELDQCRKTAVMLYDAYLTLRQRNPRMRRPCKTNPDGKIPRWVFLKCFRLKHSPTTISRWWLDLRDALDSVPEGRPTHDRLRLPLKVTPFHEDQLNRGEVKAVQIFCDRHGKWWTAFAVTLLVAVHDLKDDLPFAILGIDLGVKKAVCSVLLTEHKVSETRYFIQKEKRDSMMQYDARVADLQQAIEKKRISGDEGRLLMKLKSFRTKREDVSKTHDRILVSNLISYIGELDQKCNLFVAIGKLKGIRYAARRGNYRGNRYRGMVHRWSYFRITEALKHGLAQLGWPVEGGKARIRAVPEQWTSIKCWKCGQKGYRPKQSLFVCHTCGFRTNADRNGALNIARRLITLIPLLQNETGLGRWVSPERAPAPKAVRKTRSSKQKSSLNKMEVSSTSVESAAVHHVQLDVLRFSDGSEMDDYDPAVAKAVETLPAARSDELAKSQKTEARSDGGTVSR